MIFTKNNLSARVGLGYDAYIQWRDAKNQDGFRTISLSLAGSASKPIYSAVMVKYETPFRGKSSPLLTRPQLDEAITKARNEDSLHPFLIAATGSSSDPVYAVGFREMAKKPVIDANMTFDQFQAKNEDQRGAGRILISFDAFGTSDAIRYCAIWADNPDRIAWNAESINDKGDPRQQRFDALRSIGARESLLALTPDGGITRLFVDRLLEGSGSAIGDLSPAELNDLISKESTSTPKRFPICIGAMGVEGALRCAAIFAERDDVVPRTFRIRGPEPIGLDAANRTKAQQLDQWVEDYMRAHNFRGAAMAVVEGTRLVYAKGYTLAEPDSYYRNIEPTTLFRMASVSKTFCAVAVWKALADDPNVSRNSKMQSVLGLEQPDGSKPKDGDFADIEIRHLLESNSGIDQGSLRAIIKEVKADLDQNQPLTSPQCASRIAARSMPGKPGATKDGKQATSYGSTDYFLLGLIAAKLAGVSSFEAALEKLVLKPLKMTRTRSSRSRAEARENDEALHHLPDLATNESAVHNDRRLVPVQYGDENYEVYDGAGGLSSAVVDLARLCAMFSWRTNNPLFSDDMLSKFFTDAVAATSAGSDHGYHGFDAAKGTYPSVTCRKGGGNPGVGSGFYGTTGRRFVIIVRNGEKIEDATPVDWDDDLNAIAATIDWNDGDLFPHFGMPAIPG